MIRGYLNADGRLRLVDQPIDRADETIWFDLLSPTAEERATLVTALGVDLPALEDMVEIEISSRLYFENEAVYMTATLLSQAEGNEPIVSPVTFVVAGHRLITIRYHEPRAFQTFPARAEKVAMGCNSGEAVLVALLEAIVDRIADVIERVGHDIDQISHGVFGRKETAPMKSRDFQAVLESIGHKGDLVSNIRESLVTLDRLIGFLAQFAMQSKSDKDLRTRVKTLSRDVHSLSDHADFLSQKNTFLLDASLGMINIEQNAIIKIFSVAAVAFLPPTLIASIYGMNFHDMPELSWPWGYPFALAVMAASAFLPFWYFKRRGWL